MNITNQKKNRQSKHRERILELLRSTDTHPTADWVYDQLKKEYSQLSLGTVYRNLTILLEMGLAKKIHFGSTYDRFEAKTEPHYHLICESCGKIRDFNMPITDDLNTQATRLTGFKIHHHKLEFFGLCEDCEKK